VVLWCAGFSHTHNALSAFRTSIFRIFFFAVSPIAFDGRLFFLVLGHYSGSLLSRANELPNRKEAKANISSALGLGDFLEDLQYELRGSLRWAMGSDDEPVW